MPDTITEADAPNMADISDMFTKSLSADKPISEMAQPASDAVKAQIDAAAKASELTAVKAKVADAKEPPKEAAKPKETVLSKILPKKPEAKVEPVAEAEKEKALEWKSAPEEFRTRHEKLLTEHKTVAQKAQEFERKVADYESKIKEIEAKAGDTSKADLKLVEEYTRKIEAAEAKLREVDYSRSEEYQKLHASHQEKYSQKYFKAAGDIKKFPLITGQNEAGEAVTRPVNDADIEALSRMELADRLDVVDKMFGPRYGAVVNRHMDALQEVQDTARFELNQKLTEARNNGELRTKEQRLMEQKSQSEYQQHLDTYRKQIEAEMPEVFTEPKDDTEAAEAFRNGRQFVTDTLANLGKMTPQDRAHHNAAMEAMAMAFPLLQHRESKLKSQIESLLKELEGFRGSDPGNGGAKPAASKVVEDVMGINDMASKILDAP